MKLKRLARGIAIAALLGTTALSGAATAQSPSTITGAFDVGPGGFPGNFNPLAATAGHTWLNYYYEPLVLYNAELSALQGGLATEWSLSDDLRQVTFSLVEALWHDGEPFTAEDVRFTIELAQNSDAGSIFAARLGNVESVEVVDERTVTINLSAPDAGLLDTLTKIVMLPGHILGEHDPASLATSTWWATEPVGTGPYRFEQYVTDQYVELSANEDYRLGRPLTDRLINRYFENPAAAVAALRAGEIHFTYVEADDAATFAGNDDFVVIEGASFVVNYVGFNHRVGIWDDLRVREAFMHAIDREAIVESLYDGAAALANCGYTAEHLVPGGIEPYDYDPERARALLEEADWASINGDAPITLLTYYDAPLAANVMAAVQAMLSQVGINVVPRVVDVPTYNGIVFADDPVWDDFPLVYAGLQNGPDPASINQGLNGSQIPPNGANTMRVDMPELSAAFDAALGETDASEVDARWQDVCQVMNEQLPWATMWVANRYGVASTDLVDFVWTPAPGGGPFASHPERWTLAE